MKKILFTLLLCLSSVLVFAQSHKKITVYCTIYWTGKVNYGDLKKLLPDSVSSKLIIDPKTLYGLKNQAHILLLMNTYGWKLASLITDVTGGGNISSSTEYLMSKEIYLDVPAYNEYFNTLINIEKKHGK